MIDWCRVRELRDEIGQEDFQEVVNLFLEEVEDVIACLEASPNRARLESDMHFLKGSALSLGFGDFSALCQEAETQAAKGGATDIDLVAIRHCYASSKRLFLAKLPTSMAS